MIKIQLNDRITITRELLQYTKYTSNCLSLLKKAKPKWIKFQKQKIYFTQN